MSNKGFTLTELIVTIAIIGIISMIAFPAISKLKEDNENEKYKAYENVMKSGAKLYVDSKKRDLWGKNQAGTIKLDYESLKSAGLVESFEEGKINCSDSYVCVRNSSYGVITYDTVVICKNNKNVVYDTNKQLEKEKKSQISC